jgi:hypothetical protein
VAVQRSTDANSRVAAVGGVYPVLPAAGFRIAVHEALRYELVVQIDGKDAPRNHQGDAAHFDRDVPAPGDVDYVLVSPDAPLRGGGQELEVRLAYRRGADMGPPLVVKVGSSIPQPSGFASGFTCRGQVGLNWSSDPAADGFEVEARERGAAGFRRVADLSPATTVQTVSGMRDGIEHEFRVRSTRPFAGEPRRVKGQWAVLSKTPAPRTGTQPLLLQPSGTGAYHVAGVGDPLSLSSCPKQARITSLRNASDASVLVTHAGVQAPIGPGDLTAKFDGMPVEGDYHVQRSGPTATMPLTTSLQVDWSEP